MLVGEFRFGNMASDFQLKTQVFVKYLGIFSVQVRGTPMKLNIDTQDSHTGKEIQITNQHFDRRWLGISWFPQSKKHGISPRSFDVFGYVLKQAMEDKYSCRIWSTTQNLKSQNKIHFRLGHLYLSQLAILLRVSGEFILLVDKILLFTGFHTCQVSSINRMVDQNKNLSWPSPLIHPETHKPRQGLWSGSGQSNGGWLCF